MDISKWLRETTDHAPPDDPHRPQLPELAHAQLDQAEQSLQHDRRKRHRASSDSSLLVARKAKHRRERSPPHRGNATWHEGDTSSSHEASSSQSTHKETRDKLYERRPRHKTRPDRYDPKRKGKAGEEKCKSSRKKRKGDGDRTTGLVQSFQLKNGSKNGRLTLKPDHYVGVFKHGRAGPQMGGRGNGLPDLVFNEMRFLQKPLEHQDEPCPTGPPQNSDKDGRQGQNEEISAYVKLVDRSAEAGQHKQKRQANKSDQGENPHQQPAEVSALAVVEMPGKPSLGFGNRGALPDSQRKQDAATEYFSWSDSLPRRFSSAPHRPPVVRTPPVELEIARRRSDLAPRVDLPTRRHNRDPVRECRQRPSVEESAQRRETAQPRPPGRYRPDDEARPSSQMTDPSLPRLPPPGNPARDQDDVNERLAAPTSAYRTSDILEVRLPRQLKPFGKDRSMSTTLGDDARVDKENHDPHDSMDELLERAREVLMKRPATKLSPPPSSRRPWEAISSRQSYSWKSQVGHQMDRPLPDSPWWLPSYGQLTHADLMPPDGRRMVDEITSRAPHQWAQYASNEDASIPWHAGDLQDATFGMDPTLLDVDDDQMLDVDLLAGERYVEVKDGYDQEPPGEDSDGFDGIQEEYFSGENLESRMSMNGLPAEQDLEQADSLAFEVEAEDELAGFWKPNKLY